MARLLRGANVRTLDYAAFEQNARFFVDKLGGHDTTSWARPLAQGLPGALGAELPSVGQDLIRQYAQESGGRLFEGLASDGKKFATTMFTGVGNEIASGLGVPAATIMPLVQVAQTAVMDGLGSVATGLIAQAGLGALTGGVSIVAGGLLSMALGSFFGAGKGGSPEPPTPPPPKRRTAEKPTSTPTLASVWVEVFEATVRWRRMPLGRNADATNLFYLPEGYTADTRLPANKGWQFSADDVAAGRTPYVPTTGEWGWLGPPIPWGDFVGRSPLKAYKFPHDALAAWVGYNQNLSFMLQRVIEKGFSDKAIQKGTYPHLVKFTPYFGVIGWAEWIVSSLVGDLWKSGQLQVPRPVRGGKANPFYYAGPYLPSVEKLVEARIKGLTYGSGSLQRIIDDRMRDPIGALAFVTEATRQSMATGFALSEQTANAATQTQLLKSDAQTWRDTTLDIIKSAVALPPDGRREIDDNINRNRREREKDEKTWRAGMPPWIIPAIVGTAALGAYFARRR